MTPPLYTWNRCVSVSWGTVYPETEQKELRHLDLVYSRWIFLTLSKIVRLRLYNPYRPFYVMEEC